MSMASCSIGGSNIKISAFNPSILRLSDTNKWDTRISIVQTAAKQAGLAVSWRSAQLHTVCCGSSSSKTIAVADKIAKDGSSTAEIKSSSSTSLLLPSRAEVESLVADICDTSIAEFELKLNGFRLYVLRDVTREQALPVPPPLPSPTPVYVEPTPNTSNMNGSASDTSLAISKLQLSPYGTPTLIDKAADEGLVILQSPRVGFFRRSRTIKGKRAPPACKEKQIVKEGQVLCYIDQLGGEIPIESDVSGEIIKILLEDGAPVGYGDALISILPSFPGIKKLQ
ncbi:hypothetical protein SAY87_014845 [Trapa incisa]|uniref:Lipoyl-binding domain-containing protein n=1 Tax=Trapa incisa TaxID=236973 RepID=A0AAN7H0C6_9MYRT|nr:hypothetical protein SAY87_014845 [Trapa incisa]